MSKIDLDYFPADAWHCRLSPAPRHSPFIRIIHPINHWSALTSFPNPPTNQRELDTVRVGEPIHDPIAKPVHDRPSDYVTLRYICIVMINKPLMVMVNHGDGPVPMAEIFSRGGHGSGRLLDAGPVGCAGYTSIFPTPDATEHICMD